MRLKVPLDMTPASGNRIMSLELLGAELLPHVRCPGCHQIGQLVARALDERAAGIAGSIRFFCPICAQVTLDMNTSQPLAACALKKGPDLQELNFRAVLAGITAGIGQHGLERLLGVLGVPSLGHTTYERVFENLVPHLEAEGKASQVRALQLERDLAFEAGVLPDSQGRVGIPVAYDAQWLKAGKAYNAPDGYGSGMGGRTGKCIASAYRSKVGKIKNHKGSSGSMEPAMGAQIIKEIAARGVFAESLCLDLDAKTPKAVREMCAECDLPVPRGLHDCNHYVKCVKGSFIDVKKKVKLNNVFPPFTQLQVAIEIGTALHQHRRKGDPIFLKAAIDNVRAFARTLGIKRHLINY